VNTVRAALPTRTVSDDDLNELVGIVDVFLSNEQSEQAPELRFIAYIRFDKLIEDVLLDLTEGVNPRYDQLISKCRSLQRLWKQRFGSNYLLINGDRLKAMTARGALRGLSLDVDPETKASAWQVQRGSPLDADLNPGQ
jgi:hypothetical protein